MCATYTSKFQLRGKPTKEDRLAIESVIRKRVKYLYMGLHKNPNSRFHTKNGIRRNNRMFCFAIMTDDNQFVYGEKRIVTLALTEKSYRVFKKMILTPYRYDKDTQIVVDDRIKKHEPIFFMLDMLRTQVRFTISFVKVGKMFRKVARTALRKTNWNSYGPIRQKALFSELKKDDFFGFADVDFIDSIPIKMRGQQELMRNSLVSMLYMYYISQGREYKKELAEMHRRRELEAAVNDEKTPEATTEGTQELYNIEEDKEHTKGQ